ncbi:MAG TPA: beta-galactosidase family protein [Terriglobia bacterium]|nr:beta-galactosidase family protein [Terriglobia bacterium]
MDTVSPRGKLGRREFLGAAAASAGLEALSPLLLCGRQREAVPSVEGSRHNFTWYNEDFLLDEKPFHIRSGEMHYARIPREYWRNRLKKLKSMGLNTVSTYMFWNFHETRPGEFNFAGRRDVAAFVRTAQEEGLWVILRPGPYSCAEWDFGGFPGWLLSTPDIRVRSTDPRFLSAARRYILHVGIELAHLQVTRGGPILMTQVENEYGSFGSDHAYMRAVQQMLLDAGFDVPLFTADGPTPRMLSGGTLPDVLSFINFGSDPASQFEAFARFRKNVPLMCAEFYPGWFDHWGEIHHHGNNQNLMEGMNWILSNGVSFNLYMFHGGTSFGYMNGANFGKAYEPDVTSYDYDAPLDEAGRPRAKYFDLKKLISQHSPDGQFPPLPAALPLIEIPRFELTDSARLDSMLGNPIRSIEPKPMESFGQSFGFILYRWLPKRPTKGRMNIISMNDYALIYQGDSKLAELDRRFNQNAVDVDLAPAQPLDILIENMGRINYGPRMVNDRKGITERVLLNGIALGGWQIFPLPLENLAKLQFSAKPKRGPRFYRGSFQLSSVGDTFLDMRGWGKGHVWVNGHHLGRFWKIGPQQTLFCPAPWLRTGTNELIALELETIGRTSVQGLKDPVFETVEID